MPTTFADDARTHASRYAATDLEVARGLLRSGSRSFHLASLLMPRATRDAATALYAFCRVADDAIDGQADPARSLAALDALLTRVYAGRPADDPVERLLAVAVRESALPRALLDALLEGFAWDVAGRRYADLAQLKDYAARVAGSVGVMMTLLMGERDATVLARASDLGVAMQLTNIARDVGQDAAAGRLYLPMDWLREEGIEPAAWLAAPVFSAALARVVERLLCAADVLYERATPAIALLPRYARAGVRAARLLYAEIGEDLRRHGHDALARRAHVTGRRKRALLAAALAATLSEAWRRTPRPSAVIADESRMLVRAVHPQGWSADDGAAPAPGRIEWVLMLFERLERAQ